MKKSISIILAIILVVFAISGCGKNYDDVIAMLDGGTWFFNGGSDTILNGVIFKDGKVELKQVNFDGNGIHDVSDETYEYSIDESSITIQLANENEMKIAYTVSGDSIKLGNGEYLTAEEVDAGIQGYWELRETKYVPIVGLSTQEYHVQFNSGKFSSENACPGSNLPEGQYYYYGPYEGSYTVAFGQIQTDNTHENYWFFNIINNEVNVLRYDNVFERSSTTGFPGQNGYSF